MSFLLRDKRVPRYIGSMVGSWKFYVHIFITTSICVLHVNIGMVVEVSILEILRFIILIGIHFHHFHSVVARICLVKISRIVSNGKGMSLNDSKRPWLERTCREKPHRFCIQINIFKMIHDWFPGKVISQRFKFGNLSNSKRLLKRIKYSFSYSIHWVHGYSHGLGYQLRC